MSDPSVSVVVILLCIENNTLYFGSSKLAVAIYYSGSVSLFFFVYLAIYLEADTNIMLGHNILCN